MPKRKALRIASRTRGRGHKKGRGAGLRGGRGNAGSHKTKRVMYERVGRVWGRHGFKRPQCVVSANRVINLKDLEELHEIWLAAGAAKRDGERVVIDLAAVGVDKLLATGEVSHPYHLTVAASSERAAAKIAAAGGEVTLA